MFLAELRAREAERLSYRESIRRMIGDDSGHLSEEEEEAGNATSEDDVNQEDDVLPHANSTSMTAALDAAKEDPFGRFKKMLKLGIPRVAVEDRMRKDSINPAGLNGPVPEGQVYIKPAAEPAPSAPRPSISRKRWHWAQVPSDKRTPPLLEESGWTQRSEKGAAQRISDAIKTDLLRHYTSTINRKARNAPCDSMASAGGNANLTPMILKRSQMVKRGCARMMKGQKGLNFELAVRRIKKPFAKVAEDLNDLTAVYLKVADIKTILAMWPSMSEQLVLTELLEDNATLGLSERFFVAIRAVPMVKEKLECLLFKLEFASRVYELGQLVQLVTRALNQLHSSDKFLRMMWALRDFGNFVNGQDAEAMYYISFSLESLLSLATTKSLVDPKKSLFDSFVDFIKQDYGDKNDKENYLLEFYEEINQVPLCSNVSVSAMKGEMKQLREGHRLATSLAEAASSTSTSPTAFTHFADEIGSELVAVQRLLDDLELSKQRFRCKYEENQDCPLEHNFNTIARFVSEFKTKATAVHRPVSRM
ncbi:hypothetical protein PF005_g8828 [Phytophthora fragariae]|uniref:FH2 domain-containing protein n=1 Tax=Phytophthora fragariae TaxID=53985 RepID=A0A6A3F3J5_9STRA|nr:hypothetical protein PF003_g480 [Phytophthora fragariae]KAE8939196.1 hypothetical protein PF009_g10973 [Phytophthora fragariae]KAE9114335.1 hypothetical protein PF007_g10426 [Phytophthora fragariae]KAE9114446.1 hypothetical protein PF010_g9705 [Phytophthora fragariae]KAE9142074.1 hypothetical protein PF006_g12802 [Phytophthora fragariae]